MGKYCISAQAKNGRTQSLQVICFKNSAIRTLGHEFCLRCVAIIHSHGCYDYEASENLRFLSLRDKSAHKEMWEIMLVGWGQMLPSKVSTGWWFLSVSLTSPCSFDPVSLINLNLCGEASKKWKYHLQNNARLSKGLLPICSEKNYFYAWDYFLFLFIYV